MSGGFRILWLLAILFATAREARAAGSSDDLEWKSDWPRFRPAEYALTGIAGVGAFVVYWGVKSPERPNWTGGILFDDATRDGLRLHSPGARDGVRTASDVTGAVSVLLVAGVDSVIVPLARKSGDVAFQLTLMNAEAFAVSSLLTSTLVKAVGRGRPSYEDCQANPNFDPLCATGPTASFPSGHANVAFTAAGLSCAHHLHLSLYGSPFADALACGTSVTLATATSLFRVMGDRHWASDVLVAGAIGFGVGFAGPTLLHYAWPSGSGASASVMPLTGPSTMGFMVSGIF